MAINYDRLNSRVRDKFGLSATYTPAGGTGRAVTVVIERDYFSDTPGAGIQTERLVAQAVTDDVVEIAVGDNFTFATDNLAGSFKVVEVKHDYLGMSDIVLNKA